MCLETRNGRGTDLSESPLSRPHKTSDVHNSEVFTKNLFQLNYKARETDFRALRLEYLLAFNLWFHVGTFYARIFMILLFDSN